jgi:hypothetical protein
MVHGQKGRLGQMNFRKSGFMQPLCTRTHLSSALRVYVAGPEQGPTSTCANVEHQSRWMSMHNRAECEGSAKAYPLRVGAHHRPIFPPSLWPLQNHSHTQPTGVPTCQASHCTQTLPSFSVHPLRMAAGPAGRSSVALMHT